MMVGASAGRLPGVMAAAAALATAATSADFPHRSQLNTPSIMVYAPHPSASSAPMFKFVSSCVASSCESNSNGQANTCYASSLPLAQEASHAFNPRGFACPSPRALSHLLPFNLLQSSMGSPYLRAQLPQDQLHKHFSGKTAKLLPSSAKYFPSSPKGNSGPFSFPLSNLSTHIASRFSAYSAPRPTLGPWNSMHSWHTPTPGSFSTEVSGPNCVTGEPAVAVVLLGWLGSQQKHLKKYAEWYNARGIHAVTFTVPMADILSFSVGGKAEAHVDELTFHLAMWLEEEVGNKHLIFHTFSNTGWLTYGVVLEKLLSRGNHVIDKIKGCVVDSAPSADPDPQVWASGFSAALLKKRSVASQGGVDHGGKLIQVKPQPDIAEAALLLMLEKFFCIFLQIPAINQRLTQVVNILSKQQPQCPQLYIYSTADKVIPAKSVESFIEKQRQAGRIVRACNLHSSPHVDHFRSFPDIYGKQVSSFLQECSPKP